MASKKHHKQDSTRPTKARSRRMRAMPSGATALVEDEEEARTPATRGDSREG